MVSVLDGTFLDVTLDGQPGTKHYLFLAVDPSINKLLFTKVFYSGTTLKSCTASAAIKTIETALQNEQIKETVLIHSDRGPEFTSKKYIDFVKNNPLIEGSMTAKGQPNQNAVAERMHRTFKSQLEELKQNLPTTIKRTRDLQTICDKRRLKMNSSALYKKNNGLTVTESFEQLKNTEVIEPEILLASESSLFPQTKAAAQVKKFKRDVRLASASQRISNDQLLDKIQITNMTTQHMVEQNASHLQSIGDKVDKVLETVTPKKRVTNKALLLRDPVPRTMLDTIMHASKPKACHKLTWARFQVTAALLFFTGLRINELACVSEGMILEILKEGKITFYQSKVNKHRTIRFTSHGIKAIQFVFDKNKDVLFQENSVLFPVHNSKKETAEKFTKSINKYLKIFNTEHNQKISSHSFRVTFVTNSLKHTTAHNAQKLIGHADIRSTMKYSRYSLFSEKEDLILNQMFE